MSYAWKQLRLAVRALAGAGNQRERLVIAYYKLAHLQPKDLPARVRPEFARLMQDICRYPARAVHDEIKSKVGSLSNSQVAAAAHSIIDIYDAVTRYQPLPGNAKTGDPYPAEEASGTGKEQTQPA